MNTIEARGLPTPKFLIGETAYYAEVQSVTHKHPCPDCLGKQKWSVTSPAGLETAVPCPRCSRQSFFDKSIPGLEYEKAVPAVRALTIGSIEAKTHPYYSDDSIKYMCRETGMGSGHVYYERQLHKTHDEAMRAAEAEAVEKQVQMNERPHALKNYSFSSFSCDLAAYALSWDAVYHSWDAARDYREIVDEIIKKHEDGGRIDDDDIESLRYYTEEKPWRSKHPLAAILQAVGTGDFESARKAYAELPKPEKGPNWRLNEKDSAAFIDALENPPEPNEALKAAAVRYKDVP